MIESIILVVIIVGVILIFLGQKTLFYIQRMTIDIEITLKKNHTLQIDALQVQQKQLNEFSNTISENISTLYDIASTSLTKDLYLEELREENAKLKKILKRKHK